MSRFLKLACIALALVLSGCGPSYKVQKVTYGKTKVEIQVLEGKGYSSSGSFVNAGEGKMMGVATIQCGENKLVMYGEKILLNGVEHGTSKDGDKVLLTYSGKLYVNGTERKKSG